MIITPHLLIGAAIGAKTHNLGLIVILGILSHLILDKIPHWDYGEKTIVKFRENKSLKLLILFFAELFINCSIGLSAVAIIVWQKNLLELKYLIFIIFGILISLLPDVILSFVWIFYKNLKPFSEKYINFHGKIFHSRKLIRKPTLLGLGTEILISLIAALILLL